MIFDLVMWPLTLSCDLQVRHNVKVPIVHLWSKFGYNWSKPVRTGAIWKRLTETLTDGRTDERTYRIWIAMCLHEHSFRRYNKNHSRLWFIFTVYQNYTLALTHSLREPGGPCTKSMEVSESRMERVKSHSPSLSGGLLAGLAVLWAGGADSNSLRAPFNVTSRAAAISWSWAMMTSTGGLSRGSTCNMEPGGQNK